MEIRRTANAGVLLKLDGQSILLDGVCREVKPYPATPPEEREALENCWPDVVAFTHAHKDHYDPGYAARYQRQTGGVILAPGDLPACKGSQETLVSGPVTVRCVPSRHIGLAGKTTPHASFIITGSKTIWFLGDAAPAQWRGREDLPKPQVLLVPYAYCNTPSAWAAACALGAEKIILLHMPLREEDTIGLWDAVESVTGDDPHLLIPQMGETIQIK